MNKRQFLKTATAATFSLQSLDRLTAAHAQTPPSVLAQDEAFWRDIRKGYRIKPDYINLENGYYCLQPEAILEAYMGHLREVNYQASYYMRTRQWDDKAESKRQLSELVGCAPEELIITRNTTESLDTVIAGFDWKVGDEVVFAEQDYGAMQDMFKLVARRYGVVTKIISVPTHPKSDAEVVQVYEKALTDKTKLVLVSHLINISGQILPIKAITTAIHKRNIPVLVDGAHVVGHFPLDLHDIGCDYYGSSLHKWLSCPLGAGMLYVKKERIGSLWQLYGDMGYKDDDIRKLNHTGTHPVHTDLAIQNALAYLHKIGLPKKEARMRFLQQYWTEKVRAVPNIIVNTPADAARACGIANVGVTTLKPADLAKTLLDKYKIWTVAIDYASIRGVRVTPNVYTTTDELDVFVKALKELAKV
jgi:selenocysteine lyase/cysteine desulfurase